VLQSREYFHRDAFTLSKLIYCLAFLIFGVYYASYVLINYLSARNNVGSLVAALAYSRLALYGFPLVGGLIVSLLYLPIKLVFSPVRARTDVRSTRFSGVLYGASVGLLLLVISIPFLLRGDTGATVVAETISHVTSLNGLAMLFVMIVALPIVMEMTFRGIVFRTLLAHADVPSAVVASSLLFAFIWPTMGRPVGILLGVFSALLYLRTNSLLPSIVANAVLSLLAGMFILYRAFAH